MKTPVEIYQLCSNIYTGLKEVKYPFHDQDLMVIACGRIRMHNKKINIGTPLAGQKLGIKQVEDGIWLVTFMHYDLGHLDLEQRALRSIDPPFGMSVLPMSQEWTMILLVAGEGNEPPTRRLKFNQDSCYLFELI